MADSIENDAQLSIASLKNGLTGNLELKNGRVAIRGGNTVVYTTIVGTVNFSDESVRDDEYDELTYAPSHPNATGDLYLNNGYIYLTNETGKVNLQG